MIVNEGLIYFSFFVLCFNVPLNNYGHIETVSLPNHTFSWAGLNLSG